jgi:phage portal protein BeeE
MKDSFVENPIHLRSTFSEENTQVLSPVAIAHTQTHIHTHTHTHTHFVLRKSLSAVGVHRTSDFRNVWISASWWPDNLTLNNVIFDVL